MTPRRIRLAVAFGLAALVVPEFAAGQGAGGPDTVYYRDQKKDYQTATVRGEVKESATKVDVVSGGKVLVSLSPADIVRIDYAKLPGLPDTDRLRLMSVENKDIRDAKDVVAARSVYTDLLKANPADPKTRKALEFREAMWAARSADARTGAEFEAEAKAAVEKLTAFARANPKAWEVWPAARAAARLQAELGKADNAAGTLASLGKNADLPAQLRYDARLEELDVLMRSNRVSAEPVAADLAGDKNFPATGPLRDRLTVYLAVLKAPPPKAGAKPAELVKAVEDAIGKTTDPGVRAAARNALGEYYLAHNRPRDAMWEFLWVETVWDQDRDEVVKAVGRLAKVFEQLGDKDRAEAYKEKLPRVKGAV